MRRWEKYHGSLTLGGVKPSYFGPLSHLMTGMLSYCETWDDRAPACKGALIFCRKADASAIQKRGHIALVVDEPARAFWTTFESQRMYFAASNTASSIPLIDCDPSAIIAPGAIIGGRPLKVIQIGAHPILAHCVGGVSIGAGASIGSGTAIDSGIFGEWTEVHDHVFIDNLVHVAHSVVIRTGAKVVAGAVLGGWAEIGEDAWIGINASIKQHVRVGAGATVGMGAVVLKDVPPGETWVGNPARRLR